MKILHFSALTFVCCSLLAACAGEKADNKQEVKIDNVTSVRTAEETSAEEEAAQKAEMQKAVSESAVKTCDCKGVKEYLKYTTKLEKATDAQKQAAASKMATLAKIYSSCTNPTAQQIQQQFPNRKDVTETFNSEVKKMCAVVTK